MAVSWLTVEEARLSDATSPRAAAVATALKLVSCSGIRHICHGDRETDGGKHRRGRDEWTEVMKSWLWDRALWEFWEEVFEARLYFKSVVLTIFGDFYFFIYLNVHTAILLLHKNLHPFLSTVQSIRSRYKWKAPHAAELSRSSQTAQKLV